MFILLSSGFILSLAHNKQNWISLQTVQNHPDKPISAECNDWWKPNHFFCAGQIFTSLRHLHIWSILQVLQLSDHRLFFFLTQNVSRTQQLVLAGWRNEQEDNVFTGLWNRLRGRIYAEFYKLSQAENRLGCTEEIMCHSKLSLET